MEFPHSNVVLCHVSRWFARHAQASCWQKRRNCSSWISWRGPTWPISRNEDWRRRSLINAAKGQSVWIVPLSMVKRDILLADVYFYDISFSCQPSWCNNWQKAELSVSFALQDRWRSAAYWRSSMRSTKQPRRWWILLCQNSCSPLISPSSTIKWWSLCWPEHRWPFSLFHAVQLVSCSVIMLWCSKWWTCLGYKCYSGNMAGYQTAVLFTYWHNKCLKL